MNVLISKMKFSLGLRVIYKELVNIYFGKYFGLWFVVGILEILI